jgi:hypothetical protein
MDELFINKIYNNIYIIVCYIMIINIKWRKLKNLVVVLKENRVYGWKGFYDVKELGWIKVIWLIINKFY